MTVEELKEKRDIYVMPAGIMENHGIFCYFCDPEGNTINEQQNLDDSYFVTSTGKVYVVFPESIEKLYGKTLFRVQGSFAKNNETNKWEFVVQYPHLLHRKITWETVMNSFQTINSIVNRDDGVDLYIKISSCSSEKKNGWCYFAFKNDNGEFESVNYIILTNKGNYSITKDDQLRMAISKERIHIDWNAANHDPQISAGSYYMVHGHFDENDITSDTGRFSLYTFFADTIERIPEDEKDEVVSLLDKIENNAQIYHSQDQE